MHFYFKSISKFLKKTGLWRSVRLRRILRQHARVAAFWQPRINDYFAGKTEKYPLQPKQEPGTQKIIWQYWGQGVETADLPEVVQICFNSVDRHKGDYTVIRLSDDTIAEYIDLPDFVWQKRQNSAFTRTFFSDLLRVALLKTYGGVWLDATILLTDALPEEYAQQGFFMFQRSDEEQYKRYWENVYAPYFGWHLRFKVRLLNSIIFAQKGNEVISAMTDLLLHFWETQDSIPDYFFFQILFNELVNGKLAHENCLIVNDCIPHIIQTKINGTYDSVSFDQALKLISMHKMGYFEEAGIRKLKELVGILE